MSIDPQEMGSCFKFDCCGDLGHPNSIYATGGKLLCSALPVIFCADPIMLHIFLVYLTCKVHLNIIMLALSSRIEYFKAIFSLNVSSLFNW